MNVCLCNVCAVAIFATATIVLFAKSGQKPECNLGGSKLMVNAIIDLSSMFYALSILFLCVCST